ncbi:hypothetical protein RFI_12568, partial [Reticulomyxa filosa]
FFKKKKKKKKKKKYTMIDLFEIDDLKDTTLIISNVYKANVYNSNDIPNHKKHMVTPLPTDFPHERASVEKIKPTSTIASVNAHAGQSQPVHFTEEIKMHLIQFLLQHITFSGCVCSIAFFISDREEKKQLANRISEKILHGYDNMKNPMEWKRFFQQKKFKIQEFCNSYLQKHILKNQKEHHPKQQ